MLNHFSFKETDNHSLLLTNDLGQYAFLTKGQFVALLQGTLDESSDIYQDLRQKYFIIDPFQIYDPNITSRIRDMKNYVLSPTTLHIFVVTNACNLQCVYCQAQSDPNHADGLMSVETGKRAIDIALQSPTKNLTFEFQGGEPLRNYPVIREMITYAEAVKGEKIISYTIVTNLSLLKDDMLDFFIAHGVSISTSLDGPEFLHNQNRRTKNRQGSYQYVKSGIQRIRERGWPIGAIQTTTRASLQYPREIVREYHESGMNGIFLRPLTPLGFAKAEWEQIGYTPEEFITFYREAFDEVLSINRERGFFPEHHAVYFLRKILGGRAVNYMELRSPCGAGVGQLAYYFTGDIYTCDEARMVAEAGDDAFRLGNVYTSDYPSLMSAAPCKAVCSASVLESLPGCCDCVYQPYCGVCPVVNYATNGDLIARRNRTYRCKIYEGILDYLFSLIQKGEKGTMDVLYSWIQERR